MSTTKTIDELMREVLAILPDALFDEEYGSGEIMISTGLKLTKKGVAKLDDSFLK